MRRSDLIFRTLRDGRPNMDARQAGRSIRALSSFTWHEDRHRPRAADELRRLWAYRRSDRRWCRAVVASDAFARAYAAYPPDTRLGEARRLVSGLASARAMVAEHAAGRLNPADHMQYLEHARCVAELRKLAMQAPPPHREWIEDTARRIEADAQPHAPLEHREKLYLDPWADFAPLELIGTRGRAGDDTAAFRGWMVRSLARLIPESTHNRAACIAELLTLSGVEVTRQYVAADLKDWASKERRKE